MSETVPSYRWSTSEFLRAFDAGVFEHRVELIDGDVWPVVIGDWHGKTTFRLATQLVGAKVEDTGSTLATGASLPDPDCWVITRAAVPTEAVGSRLSRWNAADVLLVVEVSDETVIADLNTKARLYGSAGYPVYWVVTPEVVYVHTGPHPLGFRSRVEYRPGERLPVPHLETTIDVDALLAD